MKVKDLISYLQKFDGELHVFGCCDHGQTPEMLSAPALVYAEEFSHSLYENWTEDKDDAEENGYHCVGVIL